MRLSFTKMHGLGNDFIVFNAATDADIPSAETFRRLGHRRTGIGFDQALVLFPPRVPGTDVYYRIFN
jgi:diaminopimelate epimerase